MFSHDIGEDMDTDDLETLTLDEGFLDAIAASDGLQASEICTGSGRPNV
jgi:hypothetical protein